MNFHAIGVIHTPFKTPEDMPVQPAGAEGAIGRLELNPELVEGLTDLDGFSHIIVLYHFHRAGDISLTVTPFLDRQKRGVFATRAPTRPNPIGLSVLRLKCINEAVLEVEDIDILDGTPLLDIKPYVPAFDRPEVRVRTGWIDASRESLKNINADKRFLPQE